MEMGHSEVVAPSDCRVMCFHTVDDATRAWVKGNRFSITALLGGNEDLAAEMEGGCVSIFRLAPQDCNRYLFPVGGCLESTTEIPGSYYSVNPIAVHHEQVDVFTENHRTVNVFRDTPAGTVVFIAVATTGSGSILQVKEPGKKAFFKKGDALGHGVGTCIMLTQKDKVNFDDDILATSETGVELYCEMGTRIGSFVGSPRSFKKLSASPDTSPRSAPKSDDKEAAAMEEACN